MTEVSPAPFQPYGTPEAPRIAVCGEARLEVDPEIARFTVAVRARGADRRAALDDLIRRNQAALDLLRSYGEAVEKLETGMLSVTPELTRRGRGEGVRTYHGVVHIEAEVADFTVIGELTGRLADLELTAVNGLWWALRPDSPAYGAARRQAVLEAVKRAREYAEALGARPVALLELADEGADHAHPYEAGPVSARAAGGYALAEAAPELDLEPRRQTVHARVNARFVITPPAL
ncbi:SIMPL domain-containing protein [Streptomyces sp. NPDC003691]